MRHAFSLILAALISTAGFATMSALPTTAAPETQTGLPFPNCVNTCVTGSETRAVPSLLLLGEATTVTLHAKSICAGLAALMHVVFVVDVSEQLEAGELHEVKADLRRIIRGLDLPNMPSTSVALVEAGDQPRTLARMTHDARRFELGVSRLRRGGGGNLALAIDEGLRELRRARVQECPRPWINEILVVYAAEPSDELCPDVERSARKAKSQGVLVATVCVGRRCGRACLRSAASSARYAFLLGRSSGLIRVFERIRDEVMIITLRRMTLVQELASGLEYVDASAVPPARFDRATRRLTWFFETVPKQGITVSWRIRPLTPGFQPVSEETEMTWSDSLGWTGGTRFLDTPWIQVFGAAEPLP